MVLVPGASTFAIPKSIAAAGSSRSTVLPAKRQPMRSDMPAVKNARRGGTEAAYQASLKAGMSSLIEDLHRDREAASGRGARASHLAT